MQRRRRMVALGVTLATLLVGVLPGATSAYSVSVGASPRWTSCQRGLAWQGSVFNIWGTQNKGTVDQCLTLLKVNDSDATADYYIVDHTAEWITTYDDAYTADNYASVTVTSSVTAKGSVYGATPTLNGSSCSNPVSVTASVQFFSVTVSPTICSGASLVRNYYNATGARWSSSDVTRTPFWETAYAIKVGQGVKPHFTVQLKIPRYTRYLDGGQYCGGGYCTPTYGYTKKWATIGWGVTVP